MTLTAQTGAPAAPPKVGLIGFGEVGSSFARGFLQDGVTGILAYDDPPGPRQADLAARRSAELGVPLQPALAALAGCEVVFSMVPQDAALPVARRVAAELPPSVLFVDVNSLAPGGKTAVAGIVAPAGIGMVDGAIMEMPVRDLHRAVILAAGPQAEALAQRMNPWGMQISPVGAVPGAAAGIKIIRSLLTKALEASVVEALVTARRYGIQDQVLDSFCALVDGKPVRELVEFFVKTHAIHAGRRLKEVAMSVETAEAAGVDPLIGQAIVARLAQTAASGLAEAQGGMAPPTLDAALAAISARWDAEAGA